MLLRFNFTNNISNWYGISSSIDLPLKTTLLQPHFKCKNFPAPLSVGGWDSLPYLGFEKSSSFDSRAFLQTSSLSFSLVIILSIVFCSILVVLLDTLNYYAVKEEFVPFVSRTTFNQGQCLQRPSLINANLYHKL